MNKRSFLKHLINAIALGLLTLPTALADNIPGQAAFKAGDYETAKEQIKAVSDYTARTDLLLLQARIDLEENKLDDATTNIESALAIEPKNANALSLQGRVFGLKASRASFFRAGKLAKKSLAAFESALAVDATHEEALIGLIRYRLSAPALFGGSAEKALVTIEQLKKVNPIAGGLEMAEIHGKRDETEQQVELLLKLSKAHPEDPRAPLALGFIHQRNRDFEQAAENFAQAVGTSKLGSDQYHPIQAARYQVGRTAVLSKTEKKQEILAGVNALSDYLTGPAFGDLPAIEWAHYRRGLLYERLGDKQSEAAQDFAVASTSEDRDLQRALGGR